VGGVLQDISSLHHVFAVWLCSWHLNLWQSLQTLWWSWKLAASASAGN